MCANAESMMIITRKLCSPEYILYAECGGPQMVIACNQPSTKNKQLPKMMTALINNNSCMRRLHVHDY